MRKYCWLLMKKKQNNTAFNEEKTKSEQRYLFPSYLWPWNFSCKWHIPPISVSTFWLTYTRSPTPHPLAQPFLLPVLMRLPNCQSKCLATQVETPVSLLGRQILGWVPQREKLVGPEHYYSCTLKSLSTASCYLGSWCCSHPALPEAKMLNALSSILWTNYPWIFHTCFCFIQPEMVFAACNEESYSIN